MRTVRFESGASRFAVLISMVAVIAVVSLGTICCTPEEDKTPIKDRRPETTRDSAPQLDRGTFGIIESVAAGGPAFPQHALAFAWKPESEDYQHHELWLFYKLDEMSPGGVPIGFIRPGEGLPDVNLRVVLEIAGDPPGTNTEDGIGLDDHEAFRQWAIQLWASKYGQPGIAPADLTLNHHIFGTY